MRVLWWGRYGNYGPNYPRNRTIMACMRELGWEVVEFRPKVSALADLEAVFSLNGRFDLVWVPCFRHRDLNAAARWAKRHKVPLVFDPLISAFDKQVNERRKFTAESAKGQKLLQRERQQMAKADLVIADTAAHGAYFSDVLSVDPSALHVIPVGAEESVFYPAESWPENAKVQVLFFGSFIGLQGPEYIAEAIGLYQGPEVEWFFLGDGPERARCEQIVAAFAGGGGQVRFLDPVPFIELPGLITQADILLGVFGTGDKTSRVIPNKVYQALACGKPVITAKNGAYPEELLVDEASGLFWVDPGNAQQIAQTVAKLAADRQALPGLGENAYRNYGNFFSNTVIMQSVERVKTLIAP